MLKKKKIIISIVSAICALSIVGFVGYKIEDSAQKTQQINNEKNITSATKSAKDKQIASDKELASQKLAKLKIANNTVVNKSTVNNKIVVNTENVTINNPTAYTKISSGTIITLEEAYILGSKADPTEGMKVINNYKYASNRYYTFELTITKSTSMLENCVMCVDKNTGKVYRYNSDGTFILFPTDSSAPTIAKVSTNITSSQALTIAIKSDPTEKVSSCYGLPSHISNVYYTFKMLHEGVPVNLALLVNKSTGKVYMMDNRGTITHFYGYGDDNTQSTTVKPSTPKAVTHTSAYIDSDGSTIQVMCKNYRGSMTASQALILAQKVHSNVKLMDSNVYMINGGTFYEFTLLDANGNDEGADSQLIISTVSGKAFKYSCDNTVSEWVNN